MQQTIREGHNPYNINYVQDSQKPGPSKTHTIEEINEILKALRNDTPPLPQQTTTSTALQNTEYEDKPTGPKGKQPLKGPAKS